MLSIYTIYLKCNWHAFSFEFTIELRSQPAKLTGRIWAPFGIPYGSNMGYPSGTEMGFESGPQIGPKGPAYMGQYVGTIWVQYGQFNYPHWTHMVPRTVLCGYHMETMWVPLYYFYVVYGNFMGPIFCTYLQVRYLYSDSVWDLLG